MSNDGHIMSVVVCPLDLTFAVDSSGTINFKGPNNWNISKKFVADVTSQLRIGVGPNDTRVALVLFSTQAEVRWHLREYQEKTSLINAILNLPYLGNKTNLNDALYLTRTQVYGQDLPRPNAVKVTVIVTDGYDDVPMVDTPLTLENASSSRSSGIRLIAVGVTNDVDTPRLITIVDSPANYHHVEDFDALSSLVDRLNAPELCLGKIIAHQSVIEGRTYAALAKMFDCRISLCTCWDDYAQLSCV